MFQVRFHGRGGQGAVTAAELLAEAAFREGRQAQAFSLFGPERMGAPVMSFCRIAGQPIHTHEPATEPSATLTSVAGLDSVAGRCPSMRRRRVSGCWW
jgi:pyruvate ferredoxin oxidoreductase gamma subunit